MKIIIALLVLCFLPGCASLNNAGNATYTLKPLVVNGSTVCCEISVSDGKERASLDVHAVKTGDNYDFTLSEKGVLAFQGQAIAAGATQAAIDAAAKAAVAAVLVPALPALAPMLGGALAAPGIGAAAVGGAAVLGVQKLNAPAVKP